MNKSRGISILIFTLMVVLGVTLALPGPAGLHGQAAGSEVDQVEEPAIGTRYYVSKTGGGSDGLSWATAFTNVQDALAAAKLAGSGEIWVAEGIYYPDIGSGQTNNSVTSTFILANSTSLYGGFKSGDSKLSDRDWDNNVTVLSGDIDGNDVTDPNGVVTDPGNINGSNAYHVVYGSGLNGTAVLDGFLITAGQANGANPYNHGGGFYCYGGGSAALCNPTLANLIFSGNIANNGAGADKDNGGAMFNNGHGGESSPSLTNVTFIANHADVGGGAMFNDGSNGGISNPTLVDVRFFNNFALSGGAMYNNGKDIGLSNPSLTNVIFSGNSSGSGGGMYNYAWNGKSSPTLINVLFLGNAAKYDGGGMFNYGASNGISSPKLTNVTFSGNVAGYGGGMFNKGVFTGYSTPEVRNGIFWNNRDKTGVGTLSANILNVEDANVDSAKTTIRNSLVQGSGGSGSWTADPLYINGGNNIDKDPMFITPVDPALAPTTAGNLRLQVSSPAIDKGENTYIAGITKDLDGKPRIVDGDFDGTPTVDMGVYEFQVYNIYLPIIMR